MEDWGQSGPSMEDWGQSGLLTGGLGAAWAAHRRTMGCSKGKVGQKLRKDKSTGESKGGSSKRKRDRANNACNLERLKTKGMVMVSRQGG